MESYIYRRVMVIDKTCRYNARVCVCRCVGIRSHVLRCWPCRAVHSWVCLALEESFFFCFFSGRNVCERACLRHPSLAHNTVQSGALTCSPHRSTYSSSELSSLGVTRVPTEAYLVLFRKLGRLGFSVDYPEAFISSYLPPSHTICS